MIRLCVFDMDGLLLDSERQMYVKCGLETSRELGRAFDEHFLTTLMGGSWDNYEIKVLEEYGADYPMEQFWELYWKKVRYIVDNVAIPLRPGVKEILDFCKEEGISMAIASSSFLEVVKKCLTNAGIINYFDKIVSVEDVEKTKPDPEIFLKTIRAFNVDKKEALIFEDAHNGAQAAINGGCRYVVVPDLAILSEEDMKKADLVTDDISNAIRLIKEENERTSGI
ncbi:MAG: HAD family phosphatase [Erysipelotrichaceae bacterium]|nr:HAD family phosphatase [Erysipelotrichaceae bacterium]